MLYVLTLLIQVPKSQFSWKDCWILVESNENPLRRSLISWSLSASFVDQFDDSCSLRKNSNSTNPIYTFFFVWYARNVINLEKDSIILCMYAICMYGGSSIYAHFGTWKSSCNWNQNFKYSKVPKIVLVDDLLYIIHVNGILGKLLKTHVTRNHINRICVTKGPPVLYVEKKSFTIQLRICSEKSRLASFYWEGLPGLLFSSFKLD